jgi:putative methionine-R-sulfoxide reductase with GAF domain
MYDPVVVDAFAKNVSALEESTKDLGPESPTLRQIADLNNPAMATAIQVSHAVNEGSSTATPTGNWSGGFKGNIDLADLAPTTLGLLTGSLSVSGCAIYLVDKDAASLLTVSIAGLVPPEYLGSKTEFGRRICGWVAANKVAALNSIAALDLDQDIGTGGLLTSLVYPILARDNSIVGVVGIYSEEQNAYTADSEAILRAVAGMIEQAIVRAGRQDNPTAVPAELAQLISKAESTRGWWPVGVVVVQFERSGNTHSTQQAALKVLRASIRFDDFLLRIDPHALLLLLLRSDGSATQDVVSRLRNELASQVETVIEWASVGREADGGGQDFTSLANAIRQTALEADSRTRRTTH